MNSRMVCVCGSSTSISVISPTLMSDSLPTETSFEKPRPRPWPRDMRLPIMLPLCDTIATGPGATSAFSSTALTDSARCAWVLTSPMQLGPSRRTPLARASLSSSACRWRPASPVSAKPSLKMVTTGTRFSQHWATAPSTASVGTMMKAWSTATGTARRLG